MFIVNKSELAAATSPHKAAVRFAGDPEYRPLRSDIKTRPFLSKKVTEKESRFLPEFYPKNVIWQYAQVNTAIENFCKKLQFFSTERRAAKNSILVTTAPPKNLGNDFRDFFIQTEVSRGLVYHQRRLRLCISSALQALYIITALPCIKIIRFDLMICNSDELMICTHSRDNIVKTKTLNTIQSLVCFYSVNIIWTPARLHKSASESGSRLYKKRTDSEMHPKSWTEMKTFGGAFLYGKEETI
ncbi:MAG: hypothetical protein J6Y74_02600 [Clostridia bacterium]|nr:hypothetical protein [Clostridia bacterium]